MIDKNYKRCKHIGIGGIKCSCCVPFLGKNLKKFLNRIFRRKSKQNLQNQENE